MSKVLLISDFSVQHTVGGAQRSNQLIIDKGRQLGHHIDEVFYTDVNKTLDVDKCVETFNSYDVVISSNLEVISAICPQIIDALHGIDHHVRFEHDMCQYLTAQRRHDLFSRCKKTLFLTDYHYQCFKNYYSDYFQNVEIIYDPIDTNQFFDFGRERQDVILYVGFMHHLKGTGQFINFARENPDKKFVCAVWGDTFYSSALSKLDNVSITGIVSYEDMPELYNNVSSLFCQPICDEPFCRSAGEALLCGVPNIINNGKIGVINELERVGIDNIRSGCNNAPINFWRTVCQ